MTTKTDTNTDANKLTLRRQSLRGLTARELKEVRGGMCQKSNPI